MKNRFYKGWEITYNSGTGSDKPQWVATKHGVTMRGNSRELVQDMIDKRPAWKSQAESIVNHLLEMAMDTGSYPDFIHPEKHTKMRDRSHPMAKNPAYPDYTPAAGAKASNWEELLASEQYQATLKRLTTFLHRLNAQTRGQDPAATPEQTPRSIGTILQAMMKSVTTAMQMEQPVKKQLEKLAINLVLDQPEFRKFREPYEAGQFKIDAQLGPAKLERAQTAPEEAPEMPEGEPPNEAAEEGDVEAEAAAMKRMQDFNPEIEKRKVINAMIHGGAVSKNYAYQMIAPELNAINPALLNLYGVSMAGSELGYFATPDQMAKMAMQHPEMQGGSSEVDFEEEDVPVVRARGMIFPMLVQEITKGLLELVSYEGLPEDPKMAKEVIDKTDFVDQESWAMIMGRGLWMRFVQALGGDEDEITMHLYNRMVQLPAPKFNQIMKTVQGGGPNAKEVLKRLAQDVRMDMEAQDRDEAGYGKEEEEPPEEEEGKESWR
jgi:hypothetical protein